ncbi:superoxide dismutase 1, partial [Coprinopsis marcescibilis]
VYFTQEWEHGPVSIKGEIIGLDLEPNAERGWHVHEFGDLTNGCTSAGLHWNPQVQNHGAPWDHERHVGDLGNFWVDENGDAYVDNQVINDRMSLNGPNSIVGRTLVVHLGTDDLGKGGQPDSLTVGASGGRLACGIIGAIADY